ncbi:MAG TPA: hypothetical protein VIN59_03270, partial [Alphaproteobacteria bacterium]
PTAALPMYLELMDKVLHENQQVFVRGGGNIYKDQARRVLDGTLSTLEAANKPAILPHFVGRYELGQAVKDASAIDKVPSSFGLGVSKLIDQVIALDIALSTKEEMYRTVHFNSYGSDTIGRAYVNGIADIVKEETYPSGKGSFNMSYKKGNVKALADMATTGPARDTIIALTERGASLEAGRKAMRILTSELISSVLKNPSLVVLEAQKSAPALVA